MVWNHRTRKIKRHRKTRHRGGSKTSSNKKTIEVPLLSKMKATDTEDKRYIKHILDKLQNNTISGKSFNSNGHIYIYNDLDQIIEILETEMYKINKDHKSNSFTFPDQSRKIIIPQLKKYIEYFKHVAKDDDHVRINYISDLYD